MASLLNPLDCYACCYFNEIQRVLLTLQIDSDYIGDPPAVEVTICNVNDNIDKAFLTDLVSIGLEQVVVIITNHSN